MDNIITALDHARQLANIASDWNLDEIEINGEMVGIYALLDEFETAIAALEAPTMEVVPNGEYQLGEHGDSILIHTSYDGEVLIQVSEKIGSSLRRAVVTLPSGWQLMRPVDDAGKQEATDND